MGKECRRSLLTPLHCCLLLATTNLFAVLLLHTSVLVSFVEEGTLYLHYVSKLCWSNPSLRDIIGWCTRLGGTFRKGWWPWLNSWGCNLIGWCTRQGGTFRKGWPYGGVFAVHSQHHQVVASLSWCALALLHCCIVAVLYCCVALLLHCHVPTLACCCIINLLTLLQLMSFVKSHGHCKHVIGCWRPLIVTPIALSNCACSITQWQLDSMQQQCSNVKWC